MNNETAPLMNHGSLKIPELDSLLNGLCILLKGGFHFERFVWHAVTLRFDYNKFIRLRNLFLYDKIGDEKMRCSENWKNWVAEIDERICRKCREKHGMIYSTDEIVMPKPPLHPFCRCRIELLLSVEAGRLTPYGTGEQIGL